MNTREAIVARIYQLCEERKTSIHALCMLSAIPPSTLKGILYGNSQNPGVVTIKKLCDGLGLSLTDFFNCTLFETLEQEIQ